MQQHYPAAGDGGGGVTGRQRTRLIGTLGEIGVGVIIVAVLALYFLKDGM